MIVQIYEIQTPQEAAKCIELGVDHIGSVIVSKNNWRSRMLKDVMQSSIGTSSKNCLIPLFDDPDAICRTLDYYRPHYVHFCSNISARDCLEKAIDRFIRLQADLKKRFPEIGIIRSIPIPRASEAQNVNSLMIARIFEPVSDMFLTDTVLDEAPVEGFIGITGKTCDWEIARKLVLQSNIPVILAGGLSPANVYYGLTQVLAEGADSCTQTNLLDNEGKIVRFRKDFRKVEKFVNEVRRAEVSLGLKERRS